jgi:hypothetical protein
MNVSTLTPRHSSTLSYLGWAGLFLGAGLYQLGGGVISDDFAELLYADFFINLASPFILGGGAILVLRFTRDSRRVKWYEIVILTVVFAVTIAVPSVILLGVGGWPLLLGAALFFSKVGWFGVVKERAKTIALLIVRGFAGPFFFFLPALLVATTVVGRSTLGINETDWVAVFGTVYFLIQAAFEEFLLRYAENTDFGSSDGIMPGR